MTVSRNILKPRIMRERLVSLGDLSARIVELLTIAPRTKGELAALTGWSVSTVRPHLERLLAVDLIGVTNAPSKKHGIQKMWYVGAEPDYTTDGDDTGADDLPKPPRYSEMKQRIVQEYEIHKFRDPMDVALFGPAQGEAA